MRVGQRKKKKKKKMVDGTKEKRGKSEAKEGGEFGMDVVS